MFKQPIAIVVLAGVTMASWVGPCLRGSEPPANLARRLQPFVDDRMIAGAVTLVATRDRVVDLSAVGFADIKSRKPMSTDAVFWVASMSKPITATALMILVDEGKVSVEDPVEKYLPEFKGQLFIAEKSDAQTVLRKPQHPIRVRDILSHLAGLPFKSPIEEPTLDLLPLAARVRSYAAQPLLHEPGSAYLYSNAGINTAGRIIEVVSGMKYEDFLAQRIFGPLGMRDTTFWPTREQLGRLAKSYKPTRDKDGLEETLVGQLSYPLDDRATRYPMPAGGLFSTAVDMAQFGQMILRGGELNGRRIVSESAVKMMTSRQTPVRLNESYGFGFSMNGRSFGHGGAYNTNIAIDPQSNLVLVFLVQNAGWRREEGKKIQPAFAAAAREVFGAAVRP